VHPSIDGEFNSVEDPGSDWMSTRGDQSPNAGIAMAAAAVITQSPVAPAAARPVRKASCFIIPPRQIADNAVA
jgi:hypothetical protein